MRGIDHDVEVEAESLYEAVALAVAEFRDDALLPDGPGIMTEVIIAVLRKPIEHRIRLKQVHDWARASVQGGSAGIMKRERVWKLLGRA